MRGYMFRNRWGALLFVALTLAGVTKLVGTEKGDGAIPQAADQFSRQKADAEQLTGDRSSSLERKSAPPVQLMPDEELIDPAVGIDPTPIDEFAAANPEEDEEIADKVVIVSRDAEGAAAGDAQVAAPPQH